MYRNNGQGFLKTKMNLLLKKLYAWGVTTRHDLSSQEFMIGSPCEGTFHRTLPPFLHPLLLLLVQTVPTFIPVLQDPTFYLFLMMADQVWRGMVEIGVRIGNINQELFQRYYSFNNNNTFYGRASFNKFPIDGLPRPPITNNTIL